MDFADTFTRDKTEQCTGKTFAMIKPDAYSNIGKILSVIEQNFSIGNIKMTRF